MIILPKNDYFAQKKLSGCRAHFPGTFVTLKHWTAIAKLQKHQNAFENQVFFSKFQQETKARKNFEFDRNAWLFQQKTIILLKKSSRAAAHIFQAHSSRWNIEQP